METMYESIGYAQLRELMDEESKSRAKEVESLERREMNGRLKNWKAKLNSGISEVAKWLKDREEGALPCIVSPDGWVAELRGQAVEMIQAHWKGVWDRFGSEEEKREKLQRAKALVKSALEKAKRRREDEAELTPEEVAEKRKTTWERPKFEEFERKIRKAKGAGGPDGWEREEVRNIPMEAVEVFV